MRMRATVTGLATPLLLAVPPVSPALHAQGGASVHNQSACTVGRAGASVASPCHDGSAVFYNPAALALRPSRVGLGSILLFLDAEFTFDDGRTADFDDQFQPVPHLYVSHRTTDRLALAIGAWAPYGLATEWPLSFEGRFVGYDNALRTVYIQPTAAYQLVPNRLAVGAGVDIVYGDIEINQRIDLADIAPFGLLGVPEGTDVADLELEGDDWTATGHLALAVRPTDRLRLGARYLHTADLDIDDGDATFSPVALPEAVASIPLPADNPFGVPAGTPLGAVVPALFEPGGPFADQGVATDLELPNQFAVGLAYLAHDRLGLHGEYQWTGWSSFDIAPLAFEALEPDTLLLLWDDTHTVRLGAEYSPGSAWTLRGGWSYNDAAEPDIGVSPLLPEARRHQLGAGAGYRSDGRLRIDAAALWVLQQDRRGRVRPLESREASPADVNVGVYEAGALELGLTVSYRFGPRR
ncbi:MAG: OmpP1/FadL family transporter [Gemmatimonadota bacterium]